MAEDHDVGAAVEVEVGEHVLGTAQRTSASGKRSAVVKAGRESDTVTRKPSSTAKAASGEAMWTAPKITNLGCGATVSMKTDTSSYSSVRLCSWSINWRASSRM